MASPPAPPRPRIRVLEYSARDLREFEIADLDAWPPLPPDAHVWLDVEGPIDAAFAHALGARLNLHPLVVEDLYQTRERPRVESYGEYLFIVLRMLMNPTAEMTIASEQVSLVLGAQFVVTAQQDVAGDVFERVREQLRNGGRLRESGSDALAYALIDAIVDAHFTVLERVDDEIDGVEDAIVRDPSPTALRDLHAIKRELARLRSSIWPLRDVLTRLERAETPLIAPETRVYFRDAYDHSVQLIETVETLRDITSSLMDIYLSSISNRLNQVMKVLTVISTIFMPLTFVTGLYGMNFQHMPELAWRYGYAMVWAVVLVLSGVMLAVFRWRRWI